MASLVHISQNGILGAAIPWAGDLPHRQSRTNRTKLLEADLWICNSTVGPEDIA
jgi:hypothetical protein